MKSEKTVAVLSRLRREPVWLCMIVVLAGGAAVIGADLRGQGINQTLMYEAIGVFAYPVFYCCFVALLLMQWRMLVIADEWLTVSNGEIKIGTRRMPIDELLGVEVRRNWIGMQRLILHRRDGADLVTNVLLLASPLSKIVPELSALVDVEYEQRPLMTFET